MREQGYDPRTMGRRYLRVFACEDCGHRVERMWQAGRELVCTECSKTRMTIAQDAIREALDAYKRACRLELLARAAAEPSGSLRTAARGAALLPPVDPS